MHLEKLQTLNTAHESSQIEAASCKATGAELSKTIGTYILHQCDLGVRHGVKEIIFFFFEMEFHSCYPGWSAMV